MNEIVISRSTRPIHFFIRRDNENKNYEFQFVNASQINASRVNASCVNAIRVNASHVNASRVNAIRVMSVVSLAVTLMSVVLLPVVSFLVVTLSDVLSVVKVRCTVFGGVVVTFCCCH